MTPQTEHAGFRLAIFEKAPPNLAIGAVRRAVEEFEEAARTHLWDVADCMRRAAQFAPDADARSAVKRARPARARLTRDGLVDLITPAVMALRRELFHQDAPPFPDEPAAVAWMEKTGATQKRASARAVAQAQALEKRLEALAKRINALRWDRHVGLAYHVHGTLAYRKARDPWVHRLLILDHKGPLARLQQVTDHLASATGIWPAALVAFILTGAPPELAPVIWSIPQKAVKVGDAWMQRQWIDVQMHVNDVTFEEFRALFRSLRQELHLGRTKTVTDADAAFLELVRAAGGPPADHPNSQGFWQRILVTWNRKCSRRFKVDYTEYRAVANRYRRLQARLRTR